MNRRFILLALLAAILVAGAVLVLAPGSKQATEAPPLAGATIGGPFSLVDQDGRPVTQDALKGRYALVYFGYTYCPDVCPVDLARLMQGLRAFEAKDAARAARVQPVFITIDPARDTVPVVKQFVNAFHPRLMGLTGNQEAVDGALKSYRVYARKVGPEEATDYLMDHSANGYLFDPDGKPMLLFTQVDKPDDIAALLDRWVK